MVDECPTVCHVCDRMDGTNTVMPWCMNGVLYNELDGCCCNTRELREKTPARLRAEMRRNNRTTSKALLW